MGKISPVNGNTKLISLSILLFTVTFLQCALTQSEGKTGPEMLPGAGAGEEAPPAAEGLRENEERDTGTKEDSAEKKQEEEQQNEDGPDDNGGGEVQGNNSGEGESPPQLENGVPNAENSRPESAETRQQQNENGPENGEELQNDVNEGPAQQQNGAEHSPDSRFDSAETRPRNVIQPPAPESESSEEKQQNGQIPPPPNNSPQHDGRTSNGGKHSWPDLPGTAELEQHERERQTKNPQAQFEGADASSDSGENNIGPEGEQTPTDEELHEGELESEEEWERQREEQAQRQRQEEEEEERRREELEEEGEDGESKEEGTERRGHKGREHESFENEYGPSSPILTSLSDEMQHEDGELTDAREGSSSRRVRKRGKVAGDLASNCHRHLNECVSEEHRHAMEVYCKGTCAQLGKANVDFGLNCDPLARQGLCSDKRWGEMMYKFCKRSCTRLRGK